MDTQQIVQALSKQLDRAKGILKRQPVEKELCENWTQETRRLLVEIYGAGSKEYRDFVAANRKILTSYDIDPSYYLTQMVANLHREIRVLERCLKEKQNQLAAEEALAAVKGRKKVQTKYSAVLWAENGSAGKEVASFLEERGFKVSALGKGKGKKDALWTLVAQRDVQYGVVVLGPRKNDSNGKTPSPDGLLVAGYLAGRLGRARVLVLVEGKTQLPQTAGFLRTVPIQNAQAWRKEIESDASKMG